MRFFKAVIWSFGALVFASVALQMLGSAHHWVLDFVFAIESLPWFVTGIGFFALYRDHRNGIGWLLVVEAAIALVALRLHEPREMAAPLLAIALSDALFVIMLLRPHRLSWFAWPPIAAVGMASYSLYLLHQDIGVGVLDAWRLADSDLSSRSTVVLVPVLVATLITFSLLIYRYWEAPAKNILLTGNLGRRGSKARLPRPTNTST